MNQKQRKRRLQAMNVSAETLRYRRAQYIAAWNSGQSDQLWSEYVEEVTAQQEWMGRQLQSALFHAIDEYQFRFKRQLWVSYSAEIDASLARLENERKAIVHTKAELVW